MFLSAFPEIELLKKFPFDLVIAYDFPAVALKKIIKYCRNHKIKCVCDVSEWYTNSNKNPLFRLVRAYDSHLRMKVLHKKQDEGKLESVLTGKDIGTVLKEVNQAIYEDVIEEEWKAIEKLLKKKIQTRASKIVSQLVLTGEANRDEDSEEIEENE